MTTDDRRRTIGDGQIHRALRHSSSVLRQSWFAHELRVLGRWVREPTLWAVLLVGLVAWMLAYQVPYSFHLAIGGDQATHRREDDQPFLQAARQTYHENASFNASQPVAPKTTNNEPQKHWWELDEKPYRWTTADAIMAFPGIGSGAWVVTVRASGQPTGQTVSRWSDGTVTQEITLAQVQRDYRFLAQPDQLGNLTLRFQTEPYATPSDSRSLGFKMHAITLRSADLRLPSLAQLGLLACCVALCYGLARRLGMPQRWAGAGGLALVALVALLLARERLWLTIFTPTLLPLLVGCYILAMTLLQIADCGLQIVSSVEQRTKSREQERGTDVTVSPCHRVTVSRGVVFLIVLAFALRLGGMLHPHTIFSDIGLHANDILELTVGSVYFTEGLPAEAGGGKSPYPPGQYLVLAPGQLLLPVSDDGRRLLVKIGNALLDSLVIGMLWLVLRRAGTGQRAALLGAALYLVPIPLLKSFSVGEFANIFGQGLAMPLLVLLAMGVGEYGGAGKHIGLPLHGRWRCVVALLALALLGHLGVAISLAALLPCLAVLWLWTPAARRSFWSLVLVGIVGVAFAGLFYYSAFAQLLAERFAGTAQGMVRVPETLSLAEKLQRQAQLLNTSPLLVGLGALGALLAGRAAQSVWLRRMLGAWWLGLLLSFGLLLFANQAVRWNLFLYPALCLGGGLALAALWRRGRAARIVVLSVLAFLIGQGVVYWVTQLANYLHE